MSWDWEILSERSDLDVQLVDDYPDNDWDWEALSNRPDLEWQFVLDNPDLPWQLNLVVNRPVNEILLHLDDYTDEELSNLSFYGHMPGTLTSQLEVLVIDSIQLASLIIELMR